MTPKLAPIVFTLLLAASARAGGVAVFEGPSAGIGNVRVYDELSGALTNTPLALQGVQLLPIEFVGRTRLQEYLPGRPRRKTDIGTASRLALSQNHGSLYRYARPEASGTSFGFFRIAADGSIVTLLERPGTGPLGTQDPFLPRVALAPAGDEVLVATTLSAGGNLYETDLVSGNAVDRTSALPPLRFGAVGLCLTAQVGIGITNTGILRFDRGAPGDASAVSFAPLANPAWFSGQLVASRSGVWFLTTAGADAANQYPFAFDGTSAALQVDSNPATISGAGFAPDVDDGPYMAIRDDGQQAAWRIETPLSREIMLGRVQPPPGDQPQMLSSTANFLDTLDEIGLVYFRPSGALHVAIGKSPAGAGGTFDAFDSYDVTLPASPSPASFINLSLWSGDALAPFTVAPACKPRDWVLLPDNETLLVHDDLPTDGVLDVVRPGQAGAQPVLGFLKRLDGLEFAGRWMIADIRRSDNNHEEELWRMPINLTQPATLLLSLADGTQYSRFAPRRDGWMAFVSLEPSGVETLRRAHLPSGTLQAWNTNSLPIGPALGFTQYGSVALSVDNPPTCATWTLNGQPPVSLQVPPGPFQVLPGL